MFIFIFWLLQFFGWNEEVRKEFRLEEVTYQKLIDIVGRLLRAVAWCSFRIATNVLTSTMY